MSARPRPTGSAPVTPTSSGAVTRGLALWRAGDPGALEALLPLVYVDLRRLAARHLRAERPGHTLQPTALVHEVFLRLTGRRQVHAQNRGEFFAIAGQAMRRVLVDHARRRRAQRRGNATLVSLEAAPEIADAGAWVGLLDLEQALARLEHLDERQARIVELRVFVGLDLAECAAALDLSVSTVQREWRMAAAWLRRALRPAATGP